MSEKVFEIYYKNHTNHFAKEMAKVLADNHYKSGWENDSVPDLFSRLGEEVRELGNELVHGNNKGKAKKEAIDVANFAMMIHEILGTGDSDD